MTRAEIEELNQAFEQSKTVSKTRPEKQNQMFFKNIDYASTKVSGFSVYRRNNETGLNSFQMPIAQSCSVCVTDKS